MIKLTATDEVARAARAAMFQVGTPWELCEEGTKRKWRGIAQAALDVVAGDLNASIDVAPDCGDPYPAGGCELHRVASQAVYTNGCVAVENT